MKNQWKKLLAQGSPLPQIICRLPELNVPLALLQQCVDAVACSCNRDLHKPKEVWYV